MKNGEFYQQVSGEVWDRVLRRIKALAETPAGSA